MTVPDGAAASSLPGCAMPQAGSLRYYGGEDRVPSGNTGHTRPSHRSEESAPI
jgi:hypothetical protein